jgi:hypothetical protein
VNHLELFMRRRNESCFVICLALLFLTTTSLTIAGSQALEDLELEYEVIDWGSISGYREETYIVVRTETEWAEVWEKHTTLYLPATAYPRIGFSENMVICAFMGERPTGGYSISIERVWVEEERLHVKIVKRSPAEESVVSLAITYPYVFVSLEKENLDVALDIAEENGTIVEQIMPEFSTISSAIMSFIVISIAIVVLARKARKDHSQAGY